MPIVCIKHEILENNHGPEKLAIVGLQTRGVHIARRIASLIEEIENVTIPVGIPRHHMCAEATPEDVMGCRTKATAPVVAPDLLSSTIANEDGIKVVVRVQVGQSDENAGDGYFVGDDVVLEVYEGHHNKGACEYHINHEGHKIGKSLHKEYKQAGRKQLDQRILP